MLLFDRIILMVVDGVDRRRFRLTQSFPRSSRVMTGYDAFNCSEWAILCRGYSTTICTVINSWQMKVLVFWYFRLYQTLRAPGSSIKVIKWSSALSTWILVPADRVIPRSIFQLWGYRRLRHSPKPSLTCTSCVVTGQDEPSIDSIPPQRSHQLPVQFSQEFDTATWHPSGQSPQLFL